MKEICILYIPALVSLKRETNFKLPASSTALHPKMMQTTLDDVCMIVFSSTVQNYIFLLIWDVVDVLLDKFARCNIENELYEISSKRELTEQIMVIFVFSTQNC